MTPARRRCPAWPSPSCVRRAVPLEPWVGDPSELLCGSGSAVSPLALSFPHALCGGERHLQGRSHSLQFWCCCPPGSSQRWWPQGSSKPQTGYFARKRGVAMSARAKKCVVLPSPNRVERNRLQKLLRDGTQLGSAQHYWGYWV